MADSAGGLAAAGSEAAGLAAAGSAKEGSAVGLEAVAAVMDMLEVLTNHGRNMQSSTRWELQERHITDLRTGLCVTNTNGVGGMLRVNKKCTSKWNRQWAHKVCSLVRLPNEAGMVPLSMLFAKALSPKRMHPARAYRVS